MASAIARLLALALVLVACASGSVVASGDDVADLEVAVADIATLCDQERNRDQARDRLRDLSGDQLRDQLRDQDMERLFDGCAGMQVTATDVTVSGDTATVAVRYRARGRWGDGSCEFSFAREDERWRLRTLPECPRTEE
jgi:hypothetical protein